MSDKNKPVLVGGNPHRAWFTVHYSSWNFNSIHPEIQLMNRLFNTVHHSVLAIILVLLVPAARAYDEVNPRAWTLLSTPED
ncbi:MAG TPA: hypothetical protein ENG90_06175 [Gammaproteobacteria bacterium]|nr:hypothetical protein [Gammaproteobacteria bacterium]